MKSMYEKALTPPAQSPPPTPQPKRTKADWERDEREVLEEKEGLEALKNKSIPKYFDSEFGKAFLLTQVPTYCLEHFCAPKLLCPTFYVEEGKLRSVGGFSLDTHLQKDAPLPD